MAGEGLNQDDKQKLKGKARRKYISEKFAISLVTTAEAKGEVERIQAYWNAYHCQRRLYANDGKLYGKYCKTRYCTLCLAIRKAEIINKYYPVLSTWKDAHFVTLIVQAVKEDKLPRWIFGMKKAFRQIKEKYKKRHQRGVGIKLMGIKSLECNYNPIEQTYNQSMKKIIKLSTNLAKSMILMIN